MTCSYNKFDSSNNIKKSDDSSNHHQRYQRSQRLTAEPKTTLISSTSGQPLSKYHHIISKRPSRIVIHLSHLVHEMPRPISQTAGQRDRHLASVSKTSKTQYFDIQVDQRQTNCLIHLIPQSEVNKNTLLLPHTSGSTVLSPTLLWLVSYTSIDTPNTMIASSTDMPCLVHTPTCPLLTQVTFFTSAEERGPNHNFTYHFDEYQSYPASTLPQMRCKQPDSPHNITLPIHNINSPCLFTINCKYKCEKISQSKARYELV